jgi:hypothetical protein
MNTFNFLPATINGNQFLAYKQSGAYMTDYRSSSDMYSYLINKANKEGVMTSNQLRQYLQNNAENFMNNFSNSTTEKFLNMKSPNGSLNACSYADQSTLYSGGKQMINNEGVPQTFPADCVSPGECTISWLNTPLPQQGSHCS